MAGSIIYGLIYKANPKKPGKERGCTVFLLISSLRLATACSPLHRKSPSALAGNLPLFQARPKGMIVLKKLAGMYVRFSGRSTAGGFDARNAFNPPASGRGLLPIQAA